MISDPNILLTAAHAALQQGRLEAAYEDIHRLIAAFPTMEAAHHLLALIEKKAGNVEAAERAFEAALGLATDNPETLNNYANLLNEIGKGQGALEYYRRAIALRPSFADAYLNLGIVAQRLDLFEEAAAALNRAVELMPRQAKSWTALGLLYLALDRPDDAGVALDQALVLAPMNARALLARAQLALDRGEPASALSLYDRARAAGAEEARIKLGEAAARHQLGEHATAMRLIEEIVSTDPANVGAHGQLARLRWQTGGESDFASSYRIALEARPQDVGLWTSYMNMLGSAGQYEAVSAAAGIARNILGSRPELDLMEADAASELGDIERADRLFAKLASIDDPNTAIRRSRHFLRCRRPEEAARVAEPVAESHQSPLAWAYLATAWRLTDDPRWNWLEGDPRFVREIDIDLPDMLSVLADELRALHLTKTHPFDQTLRGGTQTSGSLLKRASPIIGQLRSALASAVGNFIDGLPPSDPRHPLLRQPRGVFRFAGSWSVRLTGQGFHINHVHPAGWISSAFYVSLPPVPAGSTAGWLALGEPPVELGLELAPFRMVEPRPGRLVLFPSTMWHGTRPFDDGERLTVAFDIAPQGVT